MFRECGLFNMASLGEEGKWKRGGRKVAKS